MRNIRALHYRGLSSLSSILANAAPLSYRFAPPCIRFQSSAADATGRSLGLFSAGFLREPGDFASAVQAAVKVCNGLVRELDEEASRLASGSSADSARCLASLRRIDAVSDALCKVLDAAEAVRSVHADGSWRAAAESAMASLSAYMFALNSHAPLHALMAASLRGPPGKLLPLGEAARVAALLKREFEKDGVHLPENARTQLVALNSRLAQLADAFAGGAAAAERSAGSVEVRKSDFPSLAALPSSVRAACLPVRGGTAVSVPLHSSAAQYLLYHCADEPVRRAIISGRLSAPTPNSDALHALRDAREEAACSLAGYASYSHMVSYDHLAGAPANAIVFLQKLSAALLPKALEELATLSEEKAAAAAATGTTSAGAGGDAAGNRAVAEPLPPRSSRDVLGRVEDACVRLVRALAKTGGSSVQEWDLLYLGERTLARLTGGEATGAGSGEAGMDLASVLRGLQLVSRRVFGISLLVEPLRPGEAWDAEGGGGGGGGGGLLGSLMRPSSPPPPPRSDIIRLRLRHEDEGDMGVIYLDLFSRAQKFARGAAHFVVRSGKRLHEFDGRFEAAVGAPAPPSGGVQLPIVAVVTNFALSLGPSSPPLPESTAPDTSVSKSEELAVPPHLAGALLGASQVVTLWHEFGHALHSLLSRTDFQHLAGTRGAIDFVEVPSHTMEYWARDARVVSAWAPPALGSGDDTTPPSKRFLRDFELAQSTSPRAAFAALNMQTSIAHALFDLALHGSPDCVDTILNPLPAASMAASHAAGAGAGGEYGIGGELAALGDYLATPRLSDVRVAIERAAKTYAAAGGSVGGAGVRGVADRARILALLREQGLAPEDLCLVRRLPAVGDAAATAALDASLSVPLAEPLSELQGGELSTPSPATTARTSALPPSSFRRAWHRDSSALMRALGERYTLIPAVDGAAWQAGFTHLVTYGAAYYAYLYAAAASAALWRELFAADPWSRDSGDRLRRELLSRGGADDPADMLGRLLSRGNRTLPLRPLLEAMRAL